jgi:hypothetical protein
MRIALASCTDLPGWEVDDKPLIEALESRGVNIARPAWTDDIDWNQFDITVIRTTWDYHSRIEQFLTWIDSVPRLYNNAKIVRWNTHKSYLKELESQGVLIAPTIWIPAETQTNVCEAVDELGTMRGFIKPLVGATASDTLRFDHTQYHEAQQFLNERLHLDMMIQPYIESVETEGELSAIFIGNQCTHGVQKIPVVGDYRVQDDFGASDHPYSFTPEEIANMQNVLRYVPDSHDLLYARFDYLRGADGELLLNELELVEPSLFFRHCQESANLFADAIIMQAKIEE